MNADGTVGAAVANATATVTLPVAPATVGNHEIRLRNGTATAAVPTDPGRICVKSGNGGVAGPFTVANGRFAPAGAARPLVVPCGRPGPAAHPGAAAARAWVVLRELVGHP